MQKVGRVFSYFDVRNELAKWCFSFTDFKGKRKLCLMYSKLKNYIQPRILRG